MIQRGPDVKRLAALVLAVIALAPASASASSATITRAETDPTYSTGSFEFSISWDECNTSGCAWQPFATVQPALPSYACRGDEIFDSDPNTLVVWSSGRRTSNGSASANLTDVSILAGVAGQRLCVSVVRTTRARDPLCVAQAPILGYDPATCPFIDFMTHRAMADAVLGVETPTAQDECRAAKDKLGAAKKKVKRLKQRDAKRSKIRKAKRKVSRARGAVDAAC